MSSPHLDPRSTTDSQSQSHFHSHSHARTAPSRPQSILLPPMSPDPGLTPNKLKRLSLVASSSARPASLDLDRADRRGLALSPRAFDGEANLPGSGLLGGASAGAGASPRIGALGYGVEGRSGSGSGSASGGADGPSTPRTGRKGVRSSISYSPAPRMPGYAEPAGTSRREVQLDRTAPESGPTSADNPGEEDEEDEKEAERVKAKSKRAQTLTDKHADLLTLIAQRERRVNELRQELAAQESSLAQLKSRWTTIISRSTRPSVTQSSTSTSTATGPPFSSTHPARPGSTSSSASSAISSLATLPESPESSWTILVPGSNTPSRSGSGARSRPFLASQPGGDDQGVLQSLLNTASAIGADNLINPQAIQEGKKFWGQLVKTVSAAAGGTVPTSSPSSSSSPNPDHTTSAGPVSEGRDESRDGNAGNPNTGDGALGKLDLNSLKSMLTPWQAASASPLSPPPAPSNASRLPRARPNGTVSGTSESYRSAAGSTGSSTPRSATSFSSSSVQQEPEPRQKMRSGLDVEGDSTAPKRHMRRGVARLAPAGGAMKGEEGVGLKHQDEDETSPIETGPIEWDIMAPDYVASEAPRGEAEKDRAVVEEQEDEEEDEWGW